MKEEKIIIFLKRNLLDANYSTPLIRKYKDRVFRGEASLLDEKS
jgi:hypothetical protein